jgi:hypothetical protein
VTLSTVPPLITDLLAGKLPDEPCDAIELRASAQSAKELKDNVNAASTKLGFHAAIACLKTPDLEAAHEPAAGGFAHVDLDLTYGTGRGETVPAYRCSASATQAANCSAVHPDSSTSSR